MRLRELCRRERIDPWDWDDIALYCNFIRQKCPEYTEQWILTIAKKFLRTRALSLHKDGPSPHTRVFLEYYPIVRREFPPAPDDQMKQLTKEFCEYLGLHQEVE
jgi:hypothetical protein